MGVLNRAALVGCLGLALGCSSAQGGEPVIHHTSGGASAAAGSAGDPAGSTAGASNAGGAGASSSVAGDSSTGGVGEAGALGAAGAAGADADFDSPSAQAILADYRAFAPQTPEPVSVSGYLFGLCRSPTLRENEFLASIHGDGRYLQDWANPAAVSGLAAQGAPAFPVGSVIVKEKYAGPGAAQADLVAIGLMIKRAPGFDPSRGDWDYAYYEPALGIVQNAEQSEYCGQCHAGAAATDYVFVGDFAQWAQSK